MRLWLAFATFVAAVLFVAGARALEVPKLAGRVNDHADILPPEAEARIDRKLEAHEKATGEQFAVLTLKSLEGDPLEDFSIRTVERWKLGSEKEDKGLLLLVVRDDRKVRIEVGHGLEGSITDALSSRIIRQVITPRFRAGDYPGGIEAALDRLTRHEGRGAGEAPASEAPERRGPSVLSVIALLLFAVPFVLPFMFGGRGGRRLRRSRGLGGWGYGGYVGGGFGGGGFRGGGGFSGGGGSFGGGGASGSW